MGRKPGRSSYVEFVRLCDWFRANAERLKAEKCWKTDLVRQATAALGFPVTAGAVRQAAAETGVDMRGRPSNGLPRMAEVVKAVRDLYRLTGHPLPECLGGEVAEE